MAMSTTFDICVIGAGIAGASVAAELADKASILLLERESQPGYHTTGRSAALFSTTYGPRVIRALSRASASLYDDPPQGFDRPLLTPRGALMIARQDQLASLDALDRELAGTPGIERFDGAAARVHVPLLREGHVAAAIFERFARDIDVHALHHGYLRQFKARGGEFFANAGVEILERASHGWTIEAGGKRFHATRIVNAAGAWADVVARMAGVKTVGLTPKRRTAAMIALPDGMTGHGWPMVVDIDEEFYAKPDAGKLLISPADETPSEPCDAQPDEYDVAVAVDRVETALDIQVRRIDSKWAGLRTFAADKNPVVGWGDAERSFFWLAGQGGYGIQTAPALAKLAAALILGKAPERAIMDHGIDLEPMSPGRVRFHE
ncbi:FAD-binding oxidoreductase [Mesorhizobium sp. YIM 152430]|uniref:NAD(P)/FAD-dependent oxidoreductase n=1 Tax=Mesorhizobium sp. YIM 152430 TaxID=3031761 RepID=UPI0023DA701C|nr:FAD-binding oxidoreductase [Mesorhizobium sp. YIM 152430]MDF1601407.1 FAD-binding oxidoreductase [Mesorhizobium sp. YIM 152430]